VRCALLCVLTVCGWSAAFAAQSVEIECGDHEWTTQGGESRFVQCARDGTLKYLDRRAAILDGYRRIGADFPSMGEHWINLSLLFDTQLDPRRPEVLSYVEIAGEARLLGVAYALPLLAGETPPEWPAGEAWHEHYRTLNDETISPEHRMPDLNPSRARMAMLHAWIWSDNPDGTFAADNWAIPYIRLGIIPPDGGPKDAAQALSLISGGSAHFLAQVTEAKTLSSADRNRTEAVFGFARAEVERLVSVWTTPMPSATDVTRLSEIWVQLLHAIEGFDSETRTSRQCGRVLDSC